MTKETKYRIKQIQELYHFEGVYCRQRDNIESEWMFEVYCFRCGKFLGMVNGSEEIKFRTICYKCLNLPHKITKQDLGCDGWYVKKKEPKTKTFRTKSNPTS